MNSAKSPVKRSCTLPAATKLLTFQFLVLGSFQHTIFCGMNFTAFTMGFKVKWFKNGENEGMTKLTWSIILKMFFYIYLYSNQSVSLINSKTHFPKKLKFCKECNKVLLHLNKQWNITLIQFIISGPWAAYIVFIMALSAWITCLFLELNLHKINCMHSGGTVNTTSCRKNKVFSIKHFRFISSLEGI